MATVTTTAPSKTPPWWRGLSRLSQEQVVAAITVLLLIVFALALPGFATTANILGLIRSISILGILGLGMGLIVISRSIDLSEIALMACPWAIAIVANQHGFPPLWTRFWPSPSPLALALPMALWSRSSRHQRLFVTSHHFCRLWRGILGRAGLRGLCPQDAAALLFAGRGTIFGIPMPISFLPRAALAHARLPVADLDRSLHLCAGRRSGGGAAVRHRAAALIVLEHVLVAVFAWLAGSLDRPDRQHADENRHKWVRRSST